MIKIEFSGTGEEVRNEMLKLLGFQPAIEQDKPPVQEKTSRKAETQPKPTKGHRGIRSRKPVAAKTAVWPAEEAKELLNQIRPNAQNILEELAKKPEGYPRPELIRALGSSDQAIRGQLSSVGSALRRMGNKVSPIEKEKVDGEFIYKLDPVVAVVAKK
jgi:hypothetical protein